ncbi:UNVERIFIED_CONTAM: TVP38/TMEM64 family membrane protein [Sesamum indicum]
MDRARSWSLGSFSAVHMLQNSNACPSFQSQLMVQANDSGSMIGFTFWAVAYIPLTILSVPASVLTLGGGYLFGLPVGFIADSVGATLGAGAAFLLGRAAFIVLSLLVSVVLMICVTLVAKEALDKALAEEDERADGDGTPAEPPNNEADSNENLCRPILVRIDTPQENPETPASPLMGSTPFWCLRQPSPPRPPPQSGGAPDSGESPTKVVGSGVNVEKGSSSMN